METLPTPEREVEVLLTSLAIIFILLGFLPFFLKSILRKGYFADKLEQYTYEEICGPGVALFGIGLIIFGLGLMIIAWLLI
jgi:hypothetical protein